MNPLLSAAYLLGGVIAFGLFVAECVRVSRADRRPPAYRGGRRGPQGRMVDPRSYEEVCLWVADIDRRVTKLEGVVQTVSDEAVRLWRNLAATEAADCTERRRGDAR